MFEIFLFVNPIGVYCYDTEVSVKKTVDELDISSSFHFVPITNSKVIKDDIIRRKTCGQTIDDIPEYTMAAYQALRNYHAIKLEYGNKKARCYLVSLQKAVSKDFSVYSQDLPKKVAVDLGLNYKRICDSNINKYIDDSIEQDKELARKFNIQTIPTTIFFNESGDDNGLLVEGTIAHDKLLALLKNSYCRDPQEEEQKQVENGYLPRKHLRLM